MSQAQEIAVAGSPEFTTGFRLAGVRKFANVPADRKAEELDEAVLGLLEDDTVGILVMHQEDLEHLSRSVRTEVETSVDPTVVILGGGGGSGLREQIRRAIGIDLMEEDE